jgi:hypothetical protein
MIPIATCHTNACFDAWMNCEQLLLKLHALKTSVSKKVTKVVDECALICMGTFHAMKSSSAHVNRFAILCVGICEECAELCETQTDEQFLACARICRECSERMTSIAFTNLQ